MSEYMLVFHYFVAIIFWTYSCPMCAECDRWWRSAAYEDRPRPRWEVWFQCQSELV